MISPSGEQILISCGDGSVSSFRVEELQSKIYQACLECGFEDCWLSEDLALSVEYLILGTGERREFSMEEIFSFTSRLLEDTGHHNIALRFRRNCGVLQASHTSQIESVRLLISQRIPGIGQRDLERIASLVSSSLKSLGIERVEEDLILSFAKHYLRNALAEIVPKAELSPDQAVIILSKSQIKDILVSFSGGGKYVSGGVLSLHPISRLFPSLKISISLARFAEVNCLCPPLTELALAPRFAEFSEFMCEAKTKIVALVSSELGLLPVDIPVVLRITDSIEFARKYMGVASDEDEFMRGILSCMRDFIPGELIIK
ncbi:MAG TPA: hypothetical protein PK821_00625 [Victivallales bacterium]|nr:hypothetical protein [Victivallales bacterium]